MVSVTRAGEFVHTHGRDIDKALFDFHFGKAHHDTVLEALSKYQNDDGGFGHGLEPDIKGPPSNPFATEIALSICFEADVPRDADLLARTVGHLEESQEEDGNWRFSPAVYEHELAPWFKGWSWPNLNPSCTIAGYLRALGLGSERLHARADQLFDQLATPSDLLGDAYYAVRPYVLYFVSEWDHPQRELYLSGVLWWLLRQNAAKALPDAMHFLEYVRGPETLVGQRLPSAILDEHIAALAAEQLEDGGWPVAYGDHWRAPVTVQALATLRRFGRLEAGDVHRPAEVRA
jgi:hypothetical protein